MPEDTEIRFRRLRFPRFPAVILLVFLANFVFSQITIDPVAPVCGGTTITLSANVSGVYGTESYSFEQYPYSPESWYEPGDVPVIMGDDEVFPEDNNPGLDIGFPFCFLNSSVDKFWIGSNGWISFLPNQPTTYLPTALPNPDAPKSAIFAPWQDWHPGVGPQAAEGYIFYRRTGTAPNRKLIVYWKDCPMYNCEDLRGKFQIVIHETTNIIDNHIERKPECSFQNNVATQGIQNATGTPPVYIAFGRNQNSWSVLAGQEESTHFVPSGITWHEGTPTGPVVGTGDHITITATVSTTYWAVLAACDNTGNYQASVTVTVYPLPTPTFTQGDATACQNDIKTYTTQPGNAQYDWTVTGGTVVNGGGSADNWADIQWTLAGIQSVSINYKTPDGCTAPVPTVQNVTVNAFESPVINTLSNEFCPGEAVTFTTQPGKTNYLWTYLPSGATWISGGGTSDNFVTLSWNAPGPKTITVNYTDAGCTSDPPVAKTILIKDPPAMAGVSNKSICSGENTGITLASTPSGASFSWNTPSPLCTSNITTCPAGSAGSSISDVLTLTDLNPGAVTYSVTPVLNGCTGSTLEIVVTVNPLPDIQASPASPSVCSGETTTVQLASSVTSAPVSFNWSVEPLPPGIAATPPSGTGNLTSTLANSTLAPADVSFSVSASAGSCSSASPVTVTITVKPLPDVIATPVSPVSVCSGLSPDVTFTSGVNYSPVSFSWSAATLPTGVSMTNTSGSSSIQEPISNAGPDPANVLFSVVASAGGCTAPAIPYTVVVNPRPVISIAGPQTACVNTGGHPYQTQAGNTDYTWNVSGGTFVSSGSPDNILINWTSTGLQQVSVNYTNVYGCRATEPVTGYPVNVTERPFPSITSGPLSICTGNEAVYTTQSNMQAYQWSVAPDGTFSGAGTSSITVTWTNAGPKSISVNYEAGAGCSGIQPAVQPVTVNASVLPAITSSASTVCAGQVVTYTTQPFMTNYLWTVSAGGEFTTPTAGNEVSVRWNLPGPNSVSVNFTSANFCTAPTPTVFPVVVNPLPDVTLLAPAPPVCMNSQTPYSFSVPADPGSTFTWNVLPLTGRIITPGPQSNTIQVQFSMSGTYSFSVTGINTITGCTNTSVPATVVTVFPSPEVSLTGCFDLVTTKNAKPFPLRGGRPEGASGRYTVDDPAGPAVTLFNPSLLSVGNHLVYYTYTNSEGCSDRNQVTVQVLPANNTAPCTGTVTDPRDNQVYPVVQLGVQCWMQTNLRFGSIVLGPTDPQTDNCLDEKTCLPGDPGCLQYGALYQWDELVRYQGGDRVQGLCPPGWHIPNEAEWQILSGQVTSGIGYGLAGSFLKDQNQSGSFLAVPAGIVYLSTNPSFTSGVKTSLFWTSTQDPASRKARATGLNSEGPSVSLYWSDRANALPVRCIRD